MLFAISHFIFVSKINNKITNNYLPEKKKRTKKEKQQENKDRYLFG